jgi:hypothetical protein
MDGWHDGQKIAFGENICKCKSETLRGIINRKLSQKGNKTR